MADKININTLDAFTEAPQQTQPTTGDVLVMQRGNTTQHVLHEHLKASIVDAQAATDGSIQEIVEGTTAGETTFSFSTTTPASKDNVFIWIDGRLRRDFIWSGQNVTFDEAPTTGEPYVLVHWQTVGGGGGGGTTDHGALTGLTDKEDHPGYLTLDGTRTMTGALNMGGLAVTNVGNVDGRDVSVDGAKLDTIDTSADVNPTQVSAGEITAGTATVLRSYSPANVKSFVTTHAPGGGDMLSATYDPGNVNNNVFDMAYMVESTGKKILTAAERTKLSGIEALADVTDSTNVDDAGAVMNSDSDTTPMNFVIDEDNMASNLATKVPTQQSVAAYVNSRAPTRRTGSATVPATITANKTETWTITVTAAVVADKVLSVVLPATPAADTEIFIVQTRVTAINTVTVWWRTSNPAGKSGLSGTATATVEVT